MQRLIELSFILLLSFRYGSNSAIPVRSTVVILQNVKPTPTIEKDTVSLEEFFVDSVNIGKRKFNKIELSKYRKADSFYVVVKFYSKQNGKWTLKNRYGYEKDGILGLDPKLSDFNNDGLNDLTYISATAARGANEIRRLFIYNRAKDQLISLKNSQEYPNMLYNKELNCIDAFLVSGDCTTVFLKITGDSLKEFASVSLSDGLTVRTYNTKGDEKIIFQDPTNKARFARYMNFNPLKEYDKY